MKPPGITGVVETKLEATQTVGWTGIDVTVTDGSDAEGNDTDEDWTELRGGVTVMDFAMDVTPDII